jgi:hypothetical protein
MHYGSGADYLRQPFSTEMEQRFSSLDLLLGDIDAKARAASVPMALILVPSPAQAAFVNIRPRPGQDAYAFDIRVAAIARKHGISIVDPLPSFAGRSNPMSLFYVADGHIAPQGHRILADALVEGILASGLPAFAGCKAIE